MADRPISNASSATTTDVDRETIERILAVPIDDELAVEPEAAEAPVEGPWPAP